MTANRTPGSETPQLAVHGDQICGRRSEARSWSKPCGTLSANVPVGIRQAAVPIERTTPSTVPAAKRGRGRAVDAEGEIATELGVS
jgi:hypothetical protein